MATATSGVIRGLSSSAIGLTTWNRIATRGAATPHTTAPATTLTSSPPATARRTRTSGGLLCAISRAIGSGRFLSRANAVANRIKVAVERNESCVPVSSTATGLQSSTNTATTARVLSPTGRRPSQAAPQANQTSNVARTTGTSACTSSM